MGVLEHAGLVKTHADGGSFVSAGTIGVLRTLVLLCIQTWELGELERELEEREAAHAIVMLQKN